MVKKDNQQSLSSLLKGIFRDESSRQMYFQTKIERAWQKQMGTTVNRHTQEITLRNKILYIKITSSSLKQELLYAKETIIDFANKICEEECVNQVVIV